MGIAHSVSTGNRRGLFATTVAGLLALSGVTVIGVAFTHQEHAPQPSLAVSTPFGPADGMPAGPTAVKPSSTSRHSFLANTTPNVVGPVLPVSAPRAVAIPAIGVQSPLLQLGLTAQGSLEVPAPGPDYNKAAWYRNSPTPGSLGPSVIIGHVDSVADGPSVFFNLGGLRRHDMVQITRADGTVAVFAVDDVHRYLKTQFPTQLVYGNTNHAALRLITCGGPFDRDSGSYLDNIVVMASLLRVDGAPKPS